MLRFDQAIVETLYNKNEIPSIKAVSPLISCTSIEAFAWIKSLAIISELWIAALKKIKIGKNLDKNCCCKNYLIPIIKAVWPSSFTTFKSAPEAIYSCTPTKSFARVSNAKKIFFFQIKFSYLIKNT